LLAAEQESEAKLDEAYKKHLWRRNGFYPYMSLTATAAPAPTAIQLTDNQVAYLGVSDNHSDGERFEAEIVDVASDGRITMRLCSGEIRSFYFKEVTPILTH
jgi:hypothetical protein